MKTKKILGMLLVAIVACGCGKKINYDLAYYELKGNVKSVIVKKTESNRNWRKDDFTQLFELSFDTKQHLISANTKWDEKKFIRDRRGKFVKQMIHNYSPDFYQAEYEELDLSNCKYNERGQITYYVDCGIDGSFDVYYDSIMYDSNDHIIYKHEKRTFKNYGTDKTTYYYTISNIDEHGNWTKRQIKEVHENDISYYVETRVIEYYEKSEDLQNANHDRAILNLLFGYDTHAVFSTNLVKDRDKVYICLFPEYQDELNYGTACIVHKGRNYYGVDAKFKYRIKNNTIEFTNGERVLYFWTKTIVKNVSDVSATLEYENGEIKFKGYLLPNDPMYKAVLIDKDIFGKSDFQRIKNRRL